MDPDRYCVDQAAPPGSSLHYATLFVGARERTVIVAVHALRRSLLTIVESIADPNVRAHKLNWWSGEIMEARDGQARHPVAVAITRYCGKMLWRRPEVLAMHSTIARAAANGLASEVARDRFCEDVGGGAAQLCATAVGVEHGGLAPKDIHTLGTALEGALLAGSPIARSGPQHIPDPVRGTWRRAGGGAGGEARRIVAERVRARKVLADTVRDMPRGAGPVVLAYRTLADIQLAALANALHTPVRSVSPVASISPVRKLWIAWRTARRDR